MTELWIIVFLSGFKLYYYMLVYSKPNVTEVNGEYEAKENEKERTKKQTKLRKTRGRDRAAFS